LGHSVELYKSIEAETGLATGWKMNGGLRLACNRERMTEIERQATTAHSFGLEMHLLTPSEAQALWPLMSIDDVVGAAFLPTDGQVNPSDITLALAKGARMHGAVLVEDCPVSGVELRNGRVVAVLAGERRIACETGVLMVGVARSVMRVGSAFRPARPAARFSRLSADPPKNS
jgi:4-methylaminobutanoate oxidase (formaldehyde-forming)